MRDLISDQKHRVHEARLKLFSDLQMYTHMHVRVEECSHACELSILNALFILPTVSKAHVVCYDVAASVACLPRVQYLMGSIVHTCILNKSPTLLDNCTSDPHLPSSYQPVSEQVWGERFEGQLLFSSKHSKVRDEIDGPLIGRDNHPGILCRC